MTPLGGTELQMAELEKRLSADYFKKIKITRSYKYLLYVSNNTLFLKNNVLSHKELHNLLLEFNSYNY